MLSNVFVDTLFENSYKSITMAVRITDFNPKEVRNNTYIVFIESNGYRLQLLCHSSIDKLYLHQGKEIFVEFEYEKIKDCQFDLPKDKLKSGLFPTSDPAIITVDGTVHNIQEIDSESFVVTVHIHQIAGFIAIDSDELEGRCPLMDSRLRLDVKGLTIYPLSL